MTYEETIELEENIKIKNQANEIYKLFLKNVRLDVGKYKGNGLFLHWSDEHNATYFKVGDNGFTYQCRFLHESYNVEINPSSLFRYIKEKYRGYDHFKSMVESASRTND